MSRAAVLLICPVCNKEFYKAKSDIKSSVTCCSYKCRGDFKSIHKNKTCSVCGIIFSKQTKYCSNVCANKVHSTWVKENQSGKNNAFYGKTHSDKTKQEMSKKKQELVKSGWIPASYIPDRSKLKAKCELGKDLEWRKCRKSALIRDRYICQLCKGAKATDVHHIIPRKIRKSHNLNNLISLCKPCHLLTYKKELEFVDIFLGILRNANGESLEIGNPVASIEETR